MLAQDLYYSSVLGGGIRVLLGLIGGSSGVSLAVGEGRGVRVARGVSVGTGVSLGAVVASGVSVPC